MTTRTHIRKRKRSNRLLDMVSNYRTYVSRILLHMTLCAWALSFVFAYVHDTWMLAVVVGGTLTAINTWLVFKAPFHVASIGIAICLMIFASLHVHQLHGMIEAHFGYFIFIAALFGYLNWRPLVAAAVTAAVLHVGVHILQDMGYPIYLFPDHQHSWLVVGIHAFYVVLETVVLIYLTTLTYHLLNVSRELAEVLNNLQDDDQVLNLNVSITETKDNPILVMLDNVLSNMNKAIRQTKTAEQHTSNVLTNASQDINHLVGYVQSNHQDAEQMFQELTELARFSTEVRQHVKHTVDLIEEAAAQQQQGGTAVGESETSLTQLALSLQETSSQIDTLAENCKAAMGILGEVQGIAEQTNLLALNAAIEAARAGEQGRGFAVVADEVRQLATRSQSSTQRIGDILHLLQSTSESAVSVMKESALHAQENLSKVQQAVQSFNLTGQTLTEMTTLGGQIGSATTEQENTVTALMQQAEQVKSVSDQSEAAVSRVKREVTELAQEYEQLRQGLSVFRVG